LPFRFLEKAILEASLGMQIIHLAYSINAIRQLGKINTSSVDITIAMPQDRIPYINAETMLPQKGTNCDSAFFYITEKDRSHDRFEDFFYDMRCQLYRKITT